MEKILTFLKYVCLLSCIFQNLENEINSHDALTKAVISSGQKLVKEKQVASQTIMEQVKKLIICFENLKDETQERRWRLVESHKAQHFFSEVK